MTLLVPAKSDNTRVVITLFMGRPDSSVGSVSAVQVRIPLATLVKISIIEKINKWFLHWHVSNGLTVTFRARWFHRVLPGRTPRTALAFPHQLDSRRL